jgi:protein TonB
MSPDADLLPMPPTNRVFEAAIVLSLIAHVIVLLFHFGPPDPSKLFDRSLLQVILVNAHAPKPSDHPDAFAQFNLDGGGNTDQANRHIQTPLPAQDVADPEQQLALKTKQITADEEHLHKLLSDLKSADKLNPDATRQLQQEATQGIEAATAQARPTDVSRLEGEVAQEMSALQSRPHKAFVGARTHSKAEAFYVDKWRQRVERVGTERLPTDGHGNHLEGMLMLSVEIRRDGTLGPINIERSSGSKDLDAAAIRIVKESAPFDPMPPGIVDENGVRADSLSITRTFTFVRGGAQITAAQSDEHASTSK